MVCSALRVTLSYGKLFNVSSGDVTLCLTAKSDRLPAAVLSQYNSSNTAWSDLDAIEQPWTVASSKTVAGANQTEGASPMGRGWNVARMLHTEGFEIKGLKSIEKQMIYT